jgi:hypothetical protein
VSQPYTTHETSNTRSASPTWAWRKVKLKSAPAGDSAPQALRLGSRPARRRNRNKSLWLEVTYQGGPESSWLVKTRSCCWRFAGYFTIEEVMQWANADR